MLASRNQHGIGTERMMNNRLIRRILLPSYIQFFLCFCFWVGVGIHAFPVLNKGLFILMALLMLCSIAIILSAVMLDRFYLNNIRESLKNLEELNLKLRAQRHEYLNEMQVVYGLLELGEYEDAAAYLKPVYTDIAKVSKALKTAKPAVNALLQAKMEAAFRQSVELYVEVSSDLSKIRLEQWDLCKILANLIDNALTAVGSNAGERSVRVLIGENENAYLLEVYNNGPAIPKDQQELIFKKGYSSKKEEGHGLGLGIVKEIVTSAGGRISVSSNESKTAFCVVLPKRTD